MYAKYIKRMLDFILSIIVLLLISPLMLIIATIVKIDSRGPIFFVQERLGRNGRVFKIIKFRTMVLNAEKEGDGICVNSENDNRITRIGKFLRKTSLDELPQLINIIKGDMAFVGPRPPVTYHPHKYGEYPVKQRQRFIVRPGLTGLAQVEIRNAASWDKRIEFDLDYIKKITFYGDLKIFIKTVGKIFENDSIYNSGKNEEKEKKHITSERK